MKKIEGRRVRWTNSGRVTGGTDGAIDKGAQPREAEDFEDLAEHHGDVACRGVSPVQLAVELHAGACPAFEMFGQRGAIRLGGNFLRSYRLEVSAASLGVGKSDGCSPKLRSLAGVETEKWKKEIAITGLKKGCAVRQETIGRHAAACGRRTRR